MRRRLDRVLTGLALFLTGSVLAGLGFAGVKELAIQVAIWSRSGRGSIFAAQGVYLEVPAGTESVEAPAVLQDGTLEPQRAVRGLGWTRQFENVLGTPVAAFMNRQEELTRVRRAAATRDDYRLRGVWDSWSSNRWLVSPSRGILKLGDRGKLLGSLTDEGFVPGRRAPSSFNRATQWVPNSFSWFDLYPGFASSDSAPGLRGVVHYVTPEALYRADLNVPSIARLLELDAEAVLLRLSSAHGRLYLLGKDRVEWLELADVSRRDGFDLPASVRGETYDFAEGSDGRLIFRARDPRADGVRFRVAVWHGAGRPEREFEYDFAPAGARVLDPRAAGRPPSDPTVDNVAAVCAPVLWRAVHQVPASVLERFQYRPRPNEFGAFWVSALIGAILGALIAVRSRGHSRSWAGPAAWGLFILLGGIPAFLTYLFLGGRERLTPCACGLLRSARFSSCPRCRRPAELPTRLGIEIP